jgi:alkylation response protein AidB-like acyl-CoA dehydrogenase
MSEEDDYRRGRVEVGAVLDKIFTEPMRQRILRGEERFDPDYHRMLLATGWFEAWFRPDTSDRAAAMLRLMALWDEASERGAPIDYFATTLLVCSALVHGELTETTRGIVDGAAAGHVHIALGFSEPEAGSDLAAVRTRAVRADGRWVIDGQKTWTTNGDVATHLFLLARTNADAPKHKGLTVFLVPTATAGISFTPIEILAGHHVFDTFLDQVEVDDRFRIGPVDAGWSTMRTTLAFEHGIPRQEFLGPLYDGLVALTRAADPAHQGVRADLNDPRLRELLAEIAIKRQVAHLMRRRQFRTVIAGELPGPEANRYKLFHAEAYVQTAAAMLEFGGIGASLEYGDDQAPLDGLISHAVRTAQMMTIAGGTSEIHRDVLAKRALRLDSPYCDAAARGSRDLVRAPRSPHDQPQI